MGKLVLGDAYLKYFRSREYYKSAGWRGTWALDGGGALMNQGVHGVDIIRWMMGDVESVFAYASPLIHDIEVEDTAVAVLKYANGAYGVIQGATTVNPARKRGSKFTGTRLDRLRGQRLQSVENGGWRCGTVRRERRNRRRHR